MQMSIHSLISSYRSLGAILLHLMDDPVIISNPEVHKKMQDAAGFHTLMENDIELLEAEFRAIAVELRKYQRHPNEIRSATDFSYIDKYRQIAAAGGDADLICRIAKLDRVDDILILRILRHLFNLSLDEAKGVISQNADI